MKKCLDCNRANLDEATECECGSKKLEEVGERLDQQFLDECAG